MFTEDMEPTQPAHAPAGPRTPSRSSPTSAASPAAAPTSTVTTLRFANFLGPTVDTPMAPYFSLPVVPTVLGYDARLQFVHEDDGLEVLRRATVEDHAGTYNVAGDGVLCSRRRSAVPGASGLPVLVAAGGRRRPLGPPRGLRRLLARSRSGSSPTAAAVDTTRLREQVRLHPARTRPPRRSTTSSHARRPEQRHHPPSWSPGCRDRSAWAASCRGWSACNDAAASLRMPGADEPRRHATLAVIGDGPSSWARAGRSRPLEFLRRRARASTRSTSSASTPSSPTASCWRALRPLYKHWFRVEIRGIENVPAEGGALVVANHSGTIAPRRRDGPGGAARPPPGHRHLRMLGADLVFRRRSSASSRARPAPPWPATPTPSGCCRSGELVGVWPEGFKGIGKPFSERYKLQRFGRGGFVVGGAADRRPDRARARSSAPRRSTR